MSDREADNINKIYIAVRKYYGYNSLGDELIDFMYDLAEAYERVKKGA